MRKRLIALVLALCVFAGVMLDVPAAQAASSYAVYVITNTLKVYQTPSTSAKLLSTMGFGEKMTCVTVSGDWAMVRNASGAQGYCKFDALATADPNTLNVAAKINTANAPLYKLPSTSTAVWMKLPKGSSFTAVAMTRDNDWIRLKNGNYYGYMQAKYLTTENASSTPAPTGAPSSGLVGKVYVTATSVKVYASASTSSKYLGSMYYGQDMTCLSVSGSWAKVRNSSGATGYCQIGNLSKANPNNLSQKVYINTNNAPIYAMPSTSSSVWMYLKKNASYTAVAVTPDGTWTRLKNGSYYAYIQSKYLSNSSATPTPTPTSAPTPAPTQSVSGKFYAAVTTATIYQTPSTSAKSLGLLSYGESITVNAVSDGWAQVKSSAGISGFCKFSELTDSDPNTLSQKVYITKNNAPIYKVASTSTSVWMKLAKDDSYTAVAVTPDGIWTRLKNGSYYAYILSEHISASKATPTPAPSATPTPAPTQSVSGKYYAAVTLTTVYQSADASSKSMGTLSYGESITVNAVSGDWAKVTNSSGTAGYCKFSDLTAENPNTYSQTVYINANNAPIYKIASESSAVWMTLKKNDSYKAVAVTPDGAWYRLKNGSYYAYISSKFISANKVTDPQEAVYVTVSALPVYASASASSKLLGTMCLGESMTMIGSSDGWAKVRNSAGDTGYCLVSGLSSKDVNTLNKPYYAKNKTVTLYSRSYSGASTVKTVSQNTSLMVVCISSDGTWARILLNNGSYAYVKVSALSETRIEDETSITDISSVTVYVIPTSLTVYASTSTSAKSLGTMYFGESMKCTGKGPKWARVVNSAGTVGYCDVNSITTTNPNTYSSTFYAQVNGAKVYKSPVTSSKVLSTLSLNDKVVGVTYNSERTWYRVKWDSDYGYVEARYFATSKIADSGQSTTIAKVLTCAQQYLGVPYVYGGRSPSGFDCSGFVYYVFKNAAGITLNLTAYTQGYDDRYQKITNIVDLKAGDVLYFNTVDDNDLCDHAGIYLGNNQFIHASSAGGKVMISNLGTNSSSYYYRTYSWARRIIK